MVRSWKKRYFVLQGGKLFSFLSPGGEVKVCTGEGVMELDSALLELFAPRQLRGEGASCRSNFRRLIEFFFLPVALSTCIEGTDVLGPSASPRFSIGTATQFHSLAAPTEAEMHQWIRAAQLSIALEMYFRCTAAQGVRVHL